MQRIYVAHMYNSKMQDSLLISLSSRMKKLTWQSLLQEWINQISEKKKK